MDRSSRCDCLPDSPHGCRSAGAMVVGFAPPMRRPRFAVAPSAPTGSCSWLGGRSDSRRPTSSVEPEAGPARRAAGAGPREPPKPRDGRPSAAQRTKRASGRATSWSPTKGARSAAPNITRTKDAGQKARRRRRSRKPRREDFAALAKEYSDDPGSAPRGAIWVRSPATMMVKPLRGCGVRSEARRDFGIVETRLRVSRDQANPVAPVHGPAELGISEPCPTPSSRSNKSQRPVAGRPGDRSRRRR